MSELGTDTAAEEPGHNSKQQIRSIVERVEHLEDERKQVGEEIRDIFTEAKGNGYDVKALRTIVRMRRQDAGERAEQEALLESYMHALGMV